MTMEELQKLKDDVYDDYRELLDTTCTYDEGIATRTKVMNLIDAEIERQQECPKIIGFGHAKIGVCLGQQSVNGPFDYLVLLDLEVAGEVGQTIPPEFDLNAIDDNRILASMHFSTAESARVVEEALSEIISSLEEGQA